MRDRAVALAFILVQTAPGPEAPFAYVMCVYQQAHLACKAAQLQKWGHCLCSLQRCLFISLSMTGPFSHTGSFQVTVLEAKAFPGEMTRQHRQMMQPAMRTVPPHQLLPSLCAPGPHFKASRNEQGMSSGNSEIQGQT